MTTSQAPLNGGLTFVSSEFPALPGKQALKKKPTELKIYQYDNKPLADRTPFLLVHGLRGEYYPYFRWSKVIKKFTSSEEFNNQYKIYMLRWDSTARLDDNVPQFRQIIAKLYQDSQQRPITVMALSMGGNLCYEGMLDKQTNQSVKLVFALGSPFRGSPLFCSDWIQYSIYKNLSFPWTRVDHSVAYRLYFGKNPALLKDLRWDDADQAIPNIGHFQSKLLFGPHGDLTASGMNNDRLININNQTFDKKKLICYGGYLLNPYMVQSRKRMIESTFMAPYSILMTKVPAHLAREHPVLKMLNSQISSVIPSKAAAQKVGSEFLYQLNDGITPLDSALFLPASTVKNESVCKESDLTKIRALSDVRLARVFRNIDHLTFIDGYHPSRSAENLKDELSPGEGAHNIFDWMLSDVLRLSTDSKQLARESLAPDTVQEKTD